MQPNGSRKMTANGDVPPVQADGSEWLVWSKPCLSQASPKSDNCRGLMWRPDQMSSTRVDDRQSVERLVIALPLVTCVLGRSSWHSTSNLGDFSVVFAQFRFALFVIIVLALPAGLMAATDPQLVDLGKLTMILGPAVAGLALSPSRWDRGSGVRWTWILGAAAVTLLVALGSLAVAVAVGAASVQLQGAALEAIIGPMGGSALTSVLEELGWAGGGLALAIAACGRRWGVLILGAVWAAWHLVPVVLHVGLFPYLEAATPLMIAAFIASCLIYRELLTLLRERSGTWLGAAAGHAAPNILLAGLIAAGIGLSDRPQDWPFFPAPGGLVFPLFALGAVLALRWAKGGQARSA